MISSSGFALLGLSAASLYDSHRGAHCYTDHGGVPLDADDQAISNVTRQECETLCDASPKCTAVTTHGSSGGHRQVPGDCYLRSEVNLAECEQESGWKSQWSTYTQAQPPALTGVHTYHLFEPKYTGLANKDAGDFKGDASFIFSCFTPFNASGNPEASMDHNIIEMSEVNVTGWNVSGYEKCNAPGADGRHHCPVDEGDYCCTVGPNDIKSNHASMQLPGLEFSPRKLKGGTGGFWFSFPRESQGVTWNEKLLRRISGKCLGDAWRADAGGCDECGDALDSCVANCIQSALVKNNNITLLQATWDRVFADPSECPDVPLPSSVTVV